MSKRPTIHSSGSSRGGHTADAGQAFDNRHQQRFSRQESGCCCFAAFLGGCMINSPACKALKYEAETSSSDFPAIAGPY